MKIAIVGAGIIGTTMERRWRAAQHEIVFASRDPGDERYRELRSEAEVTGIPEAVEAAGAILVAIPGGGVKGRCSPPSATSWMGGW